VIKSLSVERVGSDGRASPVPIGVIGGGLVAQAVHLPLLQRLDEHFRVVALAEPDEAVRATVAARHAISATYPDHRSLLEGGAARAVIVCSPNVTHARVVVDTLDAGVDVLVEKPLCLTPEEGDGIIAARDRAGLVVQVGYMKRFDPAVEALLDELPAPLQHIATETYDPGLRAWFGPAGGAGLDDVFSDIVLGALVHDVNLVHGVLDRCAVSVARVADAFARPDAAGATLELDDGTRCTLAWLHVPGLADFRERVAVYTGDGVRELEFPAPYVLRQPTLYRHVRAGDGGAVTTTRSSWHEAYERQLLHFHACVTAGAACRTPAEQGLEDVRLLSEIFAGALR
jgi:predicted dehydrogenase